MAQSQRKYKLNDCILVYLKIKVVNFNNGFQKGVNAGALKTYKNENGMLLIENRRLTPEAEQQIQEHPEIEQEIRMDENNYGEVIFEKAQATLKRAPQTINFNDDCIMITYMYEQRIVPPGYYFTIKPELPQGKRIFIYSIDENGEMIPFVGNVHGN